MSEQRRDSLEVLATQKLGLTKLTNCKRSPSQEKKILEHKIHIEDEKIKNTWRSCCDIPSDRRLLMFISSFSITLIIITFSCYKLSLEDVDCSSENTYIGLITLLIGLWIKSPASNG